MKDNLHPDYHEIVVQMTDGTEFITRSTYGKAGDRLHLDIDSKTHPAWTGTHRMLNRGGQLEKFNKRFAGIAKKDDAAVEGEVVAAAPAAPVEKIKLTTTASSAVDTKKKKKS